MDRARPGSSGSSQANTGHGSEADPHSGLRGDPRWTGSHLTVLRAEERRVSDSAPDGWTVARASPSLAGDWQAGLYVLGARVHWAPGAGSPALACPSQPRPLWVGWGGLGQETPGPSCPLHLLWLLLPLVFTAGTCLWGGLWACRCQGEESGVMRGRAAALAASSLPARVPRSLPAPSVCPERTGPPGSEPVHGQLTWAVLQCPWAQGGSMAAGHQEYPGDLVATSCSGLESTFEASGHQRVGQCPQRRLLSGCLLTASLPAGSTCTFWLLGAGPLGACL